MAQVVERFAQALASDAPVERAGARNGYWHGEAGMAGGA
jgi:hypothetical protein